MTLLPMFILLFLFSANYDRQNESRIQDVTIFLQRNCTSEDMAETMTVRNFVMDLVGYDNYSDTNCDRKAFG